MKAGEGMSATFGEATNEECLEMLCSAVAHNSRVWGFENPLKRGALLERLIVAFAHELGKVIEEMVEEASLWGRIKLKFPSKKRELAMLDAVNSFTLAAAVAMGGDPGDMAVDESETSPAGKLSPEDFKGSD